MIIRTTLGAVVIAFCASAVSAELITLQSVRRIAGHVTAVQTGCGPEGCSVETNSFGDQTTKRGIFQTDGSTQLFLAPASIRASQNSIVDADGRRISGSGAISGEISSTSDAFVEFMRLESIIEAEFSLTQPTSYRFTGSGSADGDAFAQIALEGPGGVFSLAGDFNAARNGVLMPGRYFFFAWATNSTSGFPQEDFTRAAFTIDFSLGAAATPEPASVILVVGGVGAIVIRRCRLRRA